MLRLPALPVLAFRGGVLAGSDGGIDDGLADTARLAIRPFARRLHTLSSSKNRIGGRGPKRALFPVVNGDVARQGYLRSFTYSARASHSVCLGRLGSPAAPGCPAP